MLCFVAPFVSLSLLLFFFRVSRICVMGSLTSKFMAQVAPPRKGCFITLHNVKISIVKSPSNELLCKGKSSLRSSICTGRVPFCFGNECKHFSLVQLFEPQSDQIVLLQVRTCFRIENKLHIQTSPSVIWHGHTFNPNSRRLVSAPYCIKALVYSSKSCCLSNSCT